VAEAVLQSSTVTHLLVTQEPDGSFSVESPQLPGFIMGRGTATELARDLEGVLVDLGVTGPLRTHRQVRGHTVEGEEFVFRFAVGPDEAERREVLDRVQAILNGDDRHKMMTMVSGPTGEAVFVVAMPNDTVGDLIDQMFPERDALVMCVPVIDRGVWSMALYSGDLDSFDEPTESLEASGWTRNTPISQVVREDAAGRKRILVNAR
jgi:hypothetical protein